MENSTKFQQILDKRRQRDAKLQEIKLSLETANSDVEQSLHKKKVFNEKLKQDLASLETLRNELLSNFKTAEKELGKATTGSLDKEAQFKKLQAECNQVGKDLAEIDFRIVNDIALERDKLAFYQDLFRTKFDLKQSTAESIIGVVNPAKTHPSVFQLSRGNPDRAGHLWGLLEDNETPMTINSDELTTDL